MTVVPSWMALRWVFESLWRQRKPLTTTLYFVYTDQSTIRQTLYTHCPTFNVSWHDNHKANYLTSGQFVNSFKYCITNYRTTRSSSLNNNYKHTDMFITYDNDEVNRTFYQGKYYLPNILSSNYMCNLIRTQNYLAYTFRKTWRFESLATYIIKMTDCGQALIGLASKQANSIWLCTRLYLFQNSRIRRIYHACDICLIIFTSENICRTQAPISVKVIYFSNYFPHWLGLLCSPEAWTTVSILILFAASMLLLASKYLIGLRISSVAPGKTNNTLVNMKLETSVLINVYKCNC